jgi:protein O-GlcNAcase/histone acetyltransferase
MQQPEFLGGVVEGFYGRPWSTTERLQLFAQIAALGMNTYFYAPKDDLKHRAIWRQLYDTSEIESFRELVHTCEEHRVNFIYGLSPGLDIRFADPRETDHIKARFEQLRAVGVRHFALLFDDLPEPQGFEEQSAHATAQCLVANEVYRWALTSTPDLRFLFCPTAYCDRMDTHEVGGAGYLDDVGRLLTPEIEVLWTGPDIVSAEIPVATIERLTERIARPPVIWDNLFANDYDARRVHCGPYSGRERDLCRATRGILLNLNNEFPMNFVPLRTFAAFLRGEGEWDPRAEFLAATAQWLGKFQTVSGSFRLEDLVLLADCFYLPYSQGPGAARLFRLLDRLMGHPVNAWGDSLQQFSKLCQQIQSLFVRLTELHDRNLWYAWFRHAWALKEELLILEKVISEKKKSGDIPAGLELTTHLPATYRGGFIDQLEKYLSVHTSNKLPPTTSI